jgi:two-component system sensor histidine kinase MprB
VSLRRRIAGAAALAVAAVAVAVGVVGYASARSNLLGETKQELWDRARPYLQPHDHGFGNQGPGRSQFGGPGQQGPAPRQPFGGAPGYFQVVQPDGTVSVPFGETANLPTSPRVDEIARKASGSFFTSAKVNGVHLEILTVGDPYDHHAIQVALPLTGVDSVLNGLLVPYGLLIGGGILLAGLLGLAISRSALRPIERFVARTERVTSSLEKPARLEEADAVELRRLAASFNQTLDALERSIDAQRQLVADASHELRTPIAALRSNIQIFLDADRLGPHERDGLQASILAELDELTQIVSDVVELARGAGPGPASRVEPLELDVLVRDAVERNQRRAPQLHFDVQLEPTVVVGDLDRVSRAITNIVDNARKWSPPEGVIEVTLRDGALSVRDHGPGFSERDLPHVFDRFYRAEDARRMPGSGLGLAIVKQAAEAYGGSVHAANSPEGGAIVTVSFASASAQDAAPGLLAH